MKIKNQELANVYGGRGLIISPTYDIFINLYKYTYRFIKSLIK